MIATARALVRLPALGVVALIRLYQATLGRMLPPRCRFHPSCSEYAARAIAENGLILGGFAASWRLVRCGPWSAGGVDEPPARARKMEPSHG